VKGGPEGKIVLLIYPLCVMEDPTFFEGTKGNKKILQFQHVNYEVITYYNC
jgi:hypothetical protein